MLFDGGAVPENVSPHVPLLCKCYMNGTDTNKNAVASSAHSWTTYMVPLSSKAHELHEAPEYYKNVSTRYRNYTVIVYGNYAYTM